MRRAVHNRASHPQPAGCTAIGSGFRATLIGMSFLPDPDEMYAIADRIAGQAAAARARADELGTAIAAADWHGLAADAFDLMADGVLGGLRRAAGRLDDAADALRRHAGTVQRMLDNLSLLGHDLLGLGVDLDVTMLDGLLHPDRLLGDAGAVLGDVVGLFGDAGGVLGDVGGLIGIG
ncbi:MAG: hypothetical protein QOF92_4513 [Pseudonocardiales bacterium]|jgi:uncharacterized protein YukE|nr:hypothetical protein [Pseudonocardiales bacterium]MDT4931646.1 hypothetical protein [Pseudonocardiales bacterium]MDT4949196.1 hypothetical protein [Pseudonocardiales bacterium]